MTIGELRNRVTFQEPSGTDGGVFADVIRNVPANIAGLSGSEGLRYGAQSAQALVKVTIRHRTDILSSWRMVDELDRSLQIMNRNDPTGKREWLEIIATELQA